MKTSSAKAREKLSKSRRTLTGAYLRPLVKYRQAKSPAEYIMQRVIAPDNVSCWIWTGGKDKDGYGQCQHAVCALKAQVARAHQLAYTTWVGKIPKDKIVCHTCDTPSCCNPGHLYAGTWADNVQDAIKRGRYSNGSKYYRK